ncbi:hypothetical protein HMPREF0281_00428 [Corynebacterium ammoniagenes DSM 20306]|uniref:Uncharacterized protein n=1 Tax=Corynebacterium ammoniagenes DSM 20306 TaxID=649754 RepID=A0ABP2IFU1_CORAM|nr:hypothetical protein HMPREF0281_00428 [Corynebacterium ammoniagenes DSM 20306]
MLDKGSSTLSMYSEFRLVDLWCFCLPCSTASSIFSNVDIAGAFEAFREFLRNFMPLRTRRCPTNLT